MYAPEVRRAPLLAIAVFACSSADEAPSAPSGCYWFQTCGPSTLGGECGTCDDGDPCTRDACIGLRCVSFVTSDACACSPSCAAGDLRVVQTVRHGDGGVAGLEELRGLAATRDGRHAYVAASTTGLVTLVATDVAPPLVAASWAAGAGVSAVALTEDERVLVSGGEQLTVFERAPETGALTALGVIPRPTQGLAVSGRRVVSLDGKSVALLDVTNARVPSAVAARALPEAAGARAATFVGDHLLVAGFDSSRLVSLDGVSLDVRDTLEGKPGLTRPDAVAALDAEHVVVAGFCDNSVAVVRVDPASGALEWVTAFDGRVGADLITTGPTEGCPSSDDGTTFIHPGALAVRSNSVAVMTGARRNLAYERLEWTGTALEWRSVLPEEPASFDGSGVDYVTDPKPALVPFDPMQLRGFVAVAATDGGFVASSAISNAVAAITDDRAAGFAQRGTGGADGMICAVGAALPPDGRHIYTSPRCHPRVGRLRVDPERGTLEPAGANDVPGASPDDSVGAVDAPTNTLVGVVSASPSLEDAGRIAAFARDPESGDLTPEGVVTFRTCGAERAFPVGVIGSPDGNDLYAADFHRQGPSCIQHAHRQPDGTWVLGVGVTSEDVGGVEAFDMSADGRHLYAGCYVAGGATLLQRDATTGALTVVDVYTRPETYGAEYAALSPDERFVYVSSPIENTVSTWSRDAESGALSWIETITANAQIPIGAAAGLTVSPEGDRLYVTSHTDDTLTVFARAQDTGRLSLSSVVRDAFDWPNWVIATPDGRHVYVAAVKSSSVSLLRRTGPAHGDGCFGSCGRR